MGGPMAKNLLKNGHKVIVNDVVSASVNKLQSEGADVGENPADVASKTSIIITMLPSRYWEIIFKNNPVYRLTYLHNHLKPEQNSTSGWKALHFLIIFLLLNSLN